MFLIQPTKKEKALPSFLCKLQRSEKPATANVKHTSAPYTKSPGVVLEGRVPSVTDALGESSYSDDRESSRDLRPRFSASLIADDMEWMLCVDMYDSAIAVSGS